MGGRLDSTGRGETWTKMEARQRPLRPHVMVILAWLALRLARCTRRLIC